MNIQRLLTRLCAGLFMFASMSAIAAPSVIGGYIIESFATGVGAVSGMTIGPDGRLYAADHNGRVIRIGSNGSVTVVAAGGSNLNGIAFTSSGRLFTAAGGSQSVFEVVAGQIVSFAYLGPSAFPTSVAAHGEVLLVSNSGNGTVSAVDMAGGIQTVLSGFSAPNGPYGISFDVHGTMHFLDHATGRVLSYVAPGTPKDLFTVSPFGGTFTGTGFEEKTFVTDTVTGNLLLLNGDGGASIFASGFSGKSSPPFIGPNGIAYDGQAMFVNDGDTIYRITPSVPTIGELIEALLARVNGVGPGKSLVNKVSLANAYHEVPDVLSTCLMLGAFVNEVHAQTGKKIRPTLAEELVAEAEVISGRLACQ